MSQTQIIAQVAQVEIAQVAKRGRKPNTAVQTICEQIVAGLKSYSGYISELIKLAQAKMQETNMVASEPTIRKYIKLALAFANKKIKIVVPKKEKTEEQKKVDEIINLQTGNVVRSGITNINAVAFALSQKMAEKGINRSKSQVVYLLKKKEKDIADRRANGILGKNGKIPAEMGLTRNPVGRPKKK